MTQRDEVRLTVPVAPGYLRLCETAAHRLAAVAELDDAEHSALVDAVRSAWMSSESDGRRDPITLVFLRRPDGVDIDIETVAAPEPPA